RRDLESTLCVLVHQHVLICNPHFLKFFTIPEVRHSCPLWLTHDQVRTRSLEAPPFMLARTRTGFSYSITDLTNQYPSRFSVGSKKIRLVTSICRKKNHKLLLILVLKQYCKIGLTIGIE